MATTRQFGIITDGVSSLSAGICVNSLDIAENIETAEAKNETGQTTDIAGFSKGSTISLTGVLDTAKGNVATAGSVITIDGKSWIIDSVSRRESNTSFVEVSVTGKSADNAEVYMVGGNNA